MFRRTLISTYLIVFLLGAGLFFIGFNGQKSDFGQSNAVDEDVNIFNIDFFEIEPIYDKVVYFIVDALRVDYLNIETNNPRNFIHNQFKNLNALMKNAKLSKHLRFFNFKADFPSLTTFRIKSLMSGSNPGLHELISALRPYSNGNSSTILKNLYLRNKKSVVIGDDTWSLLYNQTIHFDYKYESLDIRNFDSLDEFVQEKSKIFLNRNSDHYKEHNDWNFMVMHLMGVDHIGHYLGIDNQFLKNKLSQIDQFARETLQMLLEIDHKKNTTPQLFSQQIQNYTRNISESEKILFLVFGDHGQNEDGGHGGPCIAETSAGFFAFSTIPFLSPMESLPGWELEVDEGDTDAETDSQYQKKVPHPISFKQRIEKIKTLNQIDLVPFISSVLGVPIPENNLGIFHPDFKVHIKSAGYQHNSNSNHSELQQEITYAKIMHNNALQMFNKLLSIVRSKQRLQDEIKSKYYEFATSYQSFQDLDLKIKQTNLIHLDSQSIQDHDIQSFINISKNHYQISQEFAILLQSKLFKDRSKFNWVYIIQGFTIHFALLVFVFVITIPNFNLSMSKFMFNQKKGFLSLSPQSGTSINQQISIPNANNIKSGPLFTIYLVIVFIFSTINLFGLYFSHIQSILPHLIVEKFTVLTFMSITLIMMHILLRFRYEIKSFYFNMFRFSLSNKELRWNFYWCIMTLLCLTQFSSYSETFAINEGKIVKFLLISYQIIALFSGSKSNLRQILLPLIQLILIRFTFFFENEDFSSFNLTFLSLLKSNITRFLILMIYLIILLAIYTNILNKWNIFIITTIPIYCWFNWIENNFIVRIFGLIQLIYIITNCFLKRYRIKSKEFTNNIQLNNKLIINKWIHNHLILIYLLKKELIIPYILTSIIQLISVENLRIEGEITKDIIPVKGIDNIILLYLLSLNNFFNLGNKLKLDSIPEYVGLIGLETFHPIISQLLVVYFLTSHLYSLLILLNLPSLGFKNPRILVLGILLSKYLFTTLGVIILRENILVWQKLSPKLIYEFVFCVSFSIYSFF